MLGPSSDTEDSGQEKGVNLQRSRSGSLMLVGHFRRGKYAHEEVNGVFAGQFSLVCSFG